MPRARERFERSDVPQPSMRRNIVALIALAALAFGLFMLWNNLWMRAQRESNLDVRDYERALRTQADIAEFDEVREVEAEFDRILLFVVSDLEEPSLAGVQLIVRRLDREPVYAADIPLTTRVRNSDGAYVSLSELSASEGIIAAAQALSAPTNIRSNHLILCTEDPWEDIQALANNGDKRVVDINPDLLDKLRTDLTNDELLDLAVAIDAAGGLSHVDVQLYDEEVANADGEMEKTGRVTIGRIQLGVDTGMLERIEES